MKQYQQSGRKKALLCAMVGSAIFLSTSGVAWAEESVFPMDDVVVTATRTPLKISETGANVSVVTRAEIEKKHYSDITAALKDVNGILVMQQGFPGGEQYVRINGDDRVLVMIDGRRLNLSKLPGSMGKGATFDLNNFPSLDNVERIEIVKGPGSSLYGSEAVGGVINVITRKGKENKTSLESAYGSWGTKKYKFTTEGGENDWNWFVAAGKTEQDHFSYKDVRSGNTVDMNNSAMDQKDFSFRVDRQLGEHNSLTLNVEHVDQHKGQPYLPNGWAVSSYTKQNTKSYLDTLTNNWAMTYNFNEKKDNPGYVRVYQNYYKYDMHSYNDGAASWSNYLYSNKETGMQWQSTWKLSEKNTLVGGADWRNVSISYPGTYDNKSMRNTAFFVEDRMTFDKKWTFSPGLRYDYHSMFGSKVTPRATVNCQVDDKTNAYVSWGEFFNAPDADRLFWPTDYSMFYKGNPNLRPETGHTTTIGLNRKLNNTTELHVSAYESRLHDAISTAFDGTLYTPINVGEQKKRGFELEVSKKFSPQWSANAGYTFTHVENKDTAGAAYGNEERTVEPNAYKLGVSYNQGAWNVELMNRMATGRSTKYFTSSNYFVMDLAVNYKINKNRSAYLKVNNLTNRSYELYGYANPNQGAFPMASRYIEIGTKYTF